MSAEGDLLKSVAGACLNDVQQFIDGNTDDRRIAELVAGLVCCDLGKHETKSDETPAAPPPSYGLLKVLFTPESTLRFLRWLPPDRRFHLPAEIPARLAMNDVESALALAWRRLRALGAIRHAQAAGVLEALSAMGETVTVGRSQSGRLKALAAEMVGAARPSAVA